MKDTFLTQVQFNQLLYGSGLFGAACGSSSAKPSRKISTIYSEDLMLPVLPAVWKPKPLWTGKQVIICRKLTLFCITPATMLDQAEAKTFYFPLAQD